MKQNLPLRLVRASDGRELIINLHQVVRVERLEGGTMGNPGGPRVSVVSLSDGSTIHLPADFFDSMVGELRKGG